MISRILEHIRQFQEVHPFSHVGGSIGLFLHGVDLKRDLSKSDIDMTVMYPLSMDVWTNDFQESSSPTDFDYCARIYLSGSDVYSKMDIRISPEPMWENIQFEGHTYQVSKKRDILFWKKKFADKGILKHIDDLIVINGGERPHVPVMPVSDSTPDDLPF